MLQLKVLMKEYIEDVKSGSIVLGDNLETALELEEKHEAFIIKCNTVRFFVTDSVFVFNLPLPLSLSRRWMST